MILVTGADGIVGRAVCNALKAAKIGVIQIVRRKRYFTASDALVADLSISGCLSSLRRSEVTAVVHLAAAVPHSVYYPDTKESANMTRCIDRNLHEFQTSLGIPAVYLSTCGLYDRSLPAVKYEDDSSQMKIESPYFAAKLEGERLFAQSSTAILRLAAPVGAGLKPSVVLSRFIMAARVNRSISIWGRGTREQNFVDTRDVAELILKVLLRPRTCILNVASEVPTSMSELAKIVLSVANRGTVEFSGQPDPREGETARYSITRAKDLYLWSPKYDLASSCRLLLNEDFESNA